ncbi:MAG: hypothetical protein IPO60_15820 [Flavobacteriales bacterium]|jgi:hypothetical protein|nr:hypothetical protein [Flavobacteriales bacterium]MBK6893033.1 hypothetical protein [Flavobacteriales bacterium]MBK7249247.1 hypothetical protein [Flavobacteriales bacterium]MBK7285803.1 hypothetical protein [Flavobacteriales bacterium]MBK9058520.1 hypothetical protein [Flavobacteriales bacterium]
MKKKVTLSLNQRTVAMLRKAGARRAKPMSAIVDELVEELEKKEKAKEDDFAWLEEMGTWLSGKISIKDLEEDPRLAYAYGYKPKKKASKKE